MKKIFVLLQTYIDTLDDNNEKTEIVGVYKDKSKAEWMIECIIEQHPDAYNKTNNSFRIERFDELGVVECGQFIFKIQECEIE